MQLQTMLKFKMGWTLALGPHHDIVLSSRIRLARNLERPNFPSHASPQTLKKILDEAFAAAHKTPLLKEAAYFKLADLDAIDQQFLIERHLISPALAENPSQRGVVVAGQETLGLMVNEEDHLRLSCLQAGLSLREAYKQADNLDETLEKNLDFAFSPEWGYLTTCPTNLGTGLRASCLVHLPALGLSGLINRMLDNLSRAGLIARGIYGEGTKVMGDFFQIANATCLGRTEPEIITAIEKAVGQIALREKENRETLASGPNYRRLEDMIYRSIGVLTGARLLSFEEACQHLSALRMALGAGWKAPGNIALVNELLILTQPAHLQMLAQKELAAGERDFLRASIVRERLASS